MTENPRIDSSFNILSKFVVLAVANYLVSSVCNCSCCDLQIIDLITERFDHKRLQHKDREWKISINSLVGTVCVDLVLLLIHLQLRYGTIQHKKLKVLVRHVN